MEILNKKINKEDDFYVKIIQCFIDKINDDPNSMTEEELKKINAYLFIFIKNNIKKYEKKVVNKFWTMYEHKEHYIWYINDKKIKIDDEFNKIFKDNKILSVSLDNIVRKDYSKITNEDYAQAKKIKFIIEKKK